MPSGKSKTLLKNVKGKKKKEQVLEDADDYLAAAVDDEESMGKHRAGDAPKALRFARKALDLYAQGLSKHPQNFDLAYNKARLELEIATHPLLVPAVVDVSVVDILEQSISSHQYALKLEPENADTLFNIAQALTAIAEYIANDRDRPDTEALDLLDQALKYQDQCLEVQEAKYAEGQALHKQMMKIMAEEKDIEDGGARLDPGDLHDSHSDDDENQPWASVVEPVTTSTLIDTVLSKLSTLTTFCSIVSSEIANLTMYDTSKTVPWIESYSIKLLEDILPTIVRANTEELKPRAAEIALVTAIFRSNLLELAYRSRTINMESYRQELDSVFASPDLDIISSPDALMASTRALLSFNSAIADSIAAGTATSEELGAMANTQWNALSQAQKFLTAAAGLPSTKADTTALATTHLLRGDVSLLLCALSNPPISFPPAVSNRSQLLKNGEVFYRNAAKLFASGHDSGSLQQKVTAEFRCAAVQVLQKGGVKATGITSSTAQAMLRDASDKLTDSWRHEQLLDMVDEGLVRDEDFGMQSIG